MYTVLLRDSTKNSQKILVYNQTFVRENFYETETQRGIFTLAQDDRNILQNIQNAQDEKSRLREQLKSEQDARREKEDQIRVKLQTARETTWGIKTRYAGGDRIFDRAGFLDGLKGEKLYLFNYIKNISLTESGKGIDQIGEELSELGEGVSPRNFLKNIETGDFLRIENSLIYQKEIVGNQSNVVSDLITQLGNSDWVKKGLEYVRLPEIDNCPFCQQKTLTEELINNIKNYFDRTYEEDISTLKDLKLDYKNLRESIIKSDYEREYFSTEQRSKIQNLLNDLYNILDQNLRIIDKKIDEPSQKFNLEASGDTISQINNFITEINQEITSYNERLQNKETIKEQLKDAFWKP